MSSAYSTSRGIIKICFATLAFHSRAAGLAGNLTMSGQVLVLHLCLSLLELSLIYKPSNPLANQILCMPVLSGKLKYRATKVVRGNVGG